MNRRSFKFDIWYVLMSEIAWKHVQLEPLELSRKALEPLTRAILQLRADSYKFNRGLLLTVTP